MQSQIDSGIEVNHDPKANLNQKISSEKAEVCVRCGYCLPVCPTFNLTQDERYSPRGRIMMMKAYGQSKMDLREADEFMSTCLNCLNCESMCPAEVDYQSLIHTFHREKQQNFQNPNSSTFITLFTNAFANRLFFILGRIARLFGASYFARFLKVGFLRTALFSTPLISFIHPKRVKRKSLFFSRDKLTNEPKIVLFSGCTSGFEEDLLNQTYFLLLKILGNQIEVERMSQFACCGALNYHAGDEKQAQVKSTQLLSKLGANTVVLVSSSGCLAHLKSDFFTTNPQASKVVFQETLGFVLDELEKKAITLAPWTKGKVLWHLPCTQRYPGTTKSIQKFINRVDGLKDQVDFIDWGCCGSAGSYMVSKPDLSAKLAEQLVIETQKTHQRDFSEYHCIVTSNLGCKLQFNQFASQSSSIVHPIELLADLVEINPA